MSDYLRTTTIPDLECAASKFILCVKRTQEGKTFTAISQISKEIEQDDECGRSIHMVFVMNTLLGGRQFSSRLRSIENQYGKGSVVVFASKYDGPYRHVRKMIELRGLCLDEHECPRVIVMCSNSIRYEDGVDFIRVLDRNVTPIKRVFAYYDELHKYISDKLRTQIEEIHNLGIVQGIVALTATPDPIWQATGFWSQLRLIYLDNFDDSDYAGIDTMVHIHVDDYYESPYRRPSAFDFDSLDFETLGFIEHVLDRYPTMLADGSRTFIPAHVRRIGHERVREMVFAKQPHAVVAVINGKEKTLGWIVNGTGDFRTVELSSANVDTSTEEICESIARRIREQGLQGRPLVVTGFLCVGMGQTLTHSSLGSFTSAILGHMDLTNAELYQLFGRITGRMRRWSTYAQTSVYCSSIVWNRCRVMEQCARLIAMDHNGEVVAEEQYYEPVAEMGAAGQDLLDNVRRKKKARMTKQARASDTDKDHRCFDTQDEAILFSTEVLRYPLRHRKTNHAPKGCCKEQGRNPTVDEILHRMWGLDKNVTTVRMLPTDQGRWCVYWRPSLLAQETNAQVGDAANAPEENA